MHVQLPAYPVRAGLGVHSARDIAGALLSKDCPEPSKRALAISLVHGSATIGRMPLSAHLAHLRDTTQAGWTAVLYTASWTTAATANPGSALMEARAVHEATIALFEELACTPTGVQEAFRDAIERFALVLSLEPESAESRQALNSLLALPSISMSEQGHRPGLIHLPNNAPDRMAVLQALMANGVGGAGTVTGRFSLHEALSGNVPKAGPERTRPVAPKSFKVFERYEAIEVLERMPLAGHPEDNKKQLQVLQKMANDSGFRSMFEVRELSALDELYERFPHFSEVADFVRGSLALAACGEEGRPAVIPPMLLKGPPGTGKTFFAQELARVIGTVFIERDLSVTSEAFVINGMDAAWKGSKAGIVFDSLVNGQHANPLILLNEVDKATETGHKNSPLAPMHALLEPTSASRFVDEFIPVAVDASKVIWVLTANNGHIPGPILSRLEVFEIAEPSVDECRKIAQSVWASIVSRTLPRGHGFPAELTSAVLDRLSRVSPRVMRKALTHAASQAALENRKYVQVTDLDASGKRYAPPARATLGFLPQQ